MCILLLQPIYPRILPLRPYPIQFKQQFLYQSVRQLSIILFPELLNKLECISWNPKFLLVLVKSPVDAAAMTVRRAGFTFVGVFVDFGLLDGGGHEADGAGVVVGEVGEVFVLGG